MCRRSARGGFTLIELLVVVAILSILASMLFPVMAQAHSKGRQTVCLSNLQQLAKAQLMYAQDWDDHLPHWWQAGDLRPPPYGRFSYWTEYFQPYLRNTAIFTDPSFDWGPLGPDRGVKLADYALFTWGAGGHGTSYSPYWRWAGPPLTMAEVNRPSETFNLMDGYTTTQIAVGMITRHAEGMNAGFLDGHAKWITADRVYEVVRDGGGEHYYRFIAADRG
jgi:prepilin-type N-terminal cleavage/methylation domain-containing protein/prepilin-type processing-associated H-X9-DG protein